MSAIARAFVAVVPPPVVLDAIETRVGPLRAASQRDDDGLRWSRREQWHLTLRFLGRVADVDPLADALRRATAATDEFQLQLGGTGAFRRAEHGTVLWIGLHQGRNELTRLAAAIERAVVDMGFEAEARGFNPHLTLARANRPCDLRALLDALGDGPVGLSWALNDLVLLASDTRATGPVYEERARFALVST
jgi:RNA 2',3'-cyclic 3'-phosphodiesterase